MNAIVETSAVRETPRTTHKMLLLLKREFWEHKGGFFWAPLIAGSTYLLFTLLAGGIGQTYLTRKAGEDIFIGGDKIRLGQVDWDQLLQSASPTTLRQLDEALNSFTLTAGIWPVMVFGIVTFFYLLGALYDERKDRSILFWKSLPVSDTQTVAAKTIMALLVGPLIAAAIALLMMLGMVIIFSSFILFNGHNPFVVYISRLEPSLLIGGILGWIPIYAVWALPSAGWLLLCSAWARSKPFLWAIILPVFTAILVSSFDLMQMFRVNSGWFWQNIVGRLLVSILPGSHGQTLITQGAINDITLTAGSFLRFISGTDLLTNPSLWIGAGAGIVMIAAAIRLRRWRDEG